MITTPGIARYFVRHQDHGPGLRCLGYGSKFEQADCGPRTLSSFGAVYIRSGRGRMLSAATHGELPIGPGTLLWQFPGVEHLYGPDERGWHERWILFDGPVADSFAALGFLDPQNPIVTHAGHSAVTQDLDRIETAAREGGPFAPLLAAAHIHHLIVAAHQRASIGTGPDYEPDPQLAKAIARIESEAFGPVDVTAIADDLGLGYSTFRRRFKAVTGTSPKAYVLDVRIARAQELLATTDEPIAAIAAAVGFDDPYYFSRLFRDRQGRSPTEFRRVYRRP